MIYTEYFVKGTQPTTVCPLHEQRSFMDAIAGVFGKESGPPPLPVGATGLPIAGSAAGADRAAAPREPNRRRPRRRLRLPRRPAAPKKRGFWSRVFGGGGDKSDEDRRKEEERRKQEQKKEEERKKKSGGR